MIKLIPISKENYDECFDLKVEEAQKSFVAPNSYSMLQGVFEDNLYSCGIYSDDTMVGYLMYEYDHIDKTWGMCRLMVDKNHQKKGYGRKAINLLIQKLKSEEGIDALYTSFEPENTVARALYESIGFKPTGDMLDGEIVEKLEII